MKVQIFFYALLICVIVFTVFILPKWRISSVLEALAEGPKSFKDLLEETGMAPKSLRKSLKDMELELGLISRFQKNPWKPVHKIDNPLCYTLTSLGRKKLEADENPNTPEEED